MGPKPPLLPDYVLHFIEYAILAALIFKAFISLDWKWPLKLTSLLAITCTVLYAASDEFHQMFVPTRTADPVDWLVDSLAAFIVVGLGVVIMRRTSQH